jgi:hypothetical protein
MFYLFHLFRSFLPLHNPIGFGAADFVEFALAAMLVCFTLAWPFWIIAARRLAQRAAWSMLFLFLLPIALRLALLAVHPIPSAAVSDDFSYLLLGDTLSHLRLANPPHPLHQFFETFYVLQDPSYSSIYALGQGIALALGQLLFRNPWAGVAVSAGALSALVYWMLRAWTSPAWSLLGGVFAAIEFGPLSHWMNSYWGGAVSALAGCLVFGALPRLREHGRLRDGAWLGLGLGIQLLSRPFESIFLLLAAAMFLFPNLRNLWKPVWIAAVAALPAIALMLLQNKQVTGSWTTMPYALSRDQFGVPTTFTFQPNPVPHRDLTPQQRLAYEIQSSVHGPTTDTARTYFDRLLSRVRFYRFFFFAPLYLALPFFLPLLRQSRFRWVALTCLLFSLGTNFYPYFYAHYIAALTCLFVLIAVASLEQLSHITIRGYPTGAQAARAIVFLGLAHFTFWYGLHLAGKEAFAVAAWRFESWDTTNYGDPEGRIAIRHRLSETQGDQLVFVRYTPQHALKEWVFNAADIDHSRVVWARDLGAVENEKLLRYYPARTPWLLEPDARPLRLVPYLKRETSPPLEPTQSQPTGQPSKPSSHPQLKFEEVH